MPLLEESQQHALRDISEMLVDLRQLVAAHGEFLAKFEQQTLTEEAPDSLDERSPPHQPWHTRPPDVQPTTRQVSAGRWRPPPSRTTGEFVPRFGLEAPLFNGDDPLGWIFGIQDYFNHYLISESIRLELVDRLIEYPASNWFHNYQQNNVDDSWEEFLAAVRHHFAPELIEDISHIADENKLNALPPNEFVVAVELVDNNVLVDTVPVEPAEVVVLISDDSCALDDILESELGQESSSLSKHEDEQQHLLRQTFPHEVEPHFVAMEREMQTLISNLKDEERQRVMMIYGMSDLGETTPARNHGDLQSYAHGDLQSYARAWICTTQQFEPKAVFSEINILIDGMEDRIFDPGAFAGVGIIQIPCSIVESGGFSMHVLKVVHPDGFEEVVIGKILREVLKGVNYLHQHFQIHRDVNDGNVLISSRGGIKMGNFGVSAYLFDAGDITHMRTTFVGTQGWMAADVIEQLHGYISRPLLDGKWGCATLQFGADKRVHIFDPGAFEMRAGSMSSLAFFTVLDHGKWNVSYGVPAIQPDDSHAGENSSRPQCRPQFQQAQRREHLFLVIERRHENKSTYLMLFEVMEMDEDGHSVVFHMKNFHFTTSSPPGRWPSVVVNADREVAGATMGDQSDDCADTYVSCEAVADINSEHEVIVSTGAGITALDIADAMIPFQDSIPSFQGGCEDPLPSVVDLYALYDDRSPMRVVEQVMELESFWLRIECMCSRHLS